MLACPVQAKEEVDWNMVDSGCWSSLEMLGSGCLHHPVRVADWVRCHEHSQHQAPIEQHEESRRTLGGLPVSVVTLPFSLKEENCTGEPAVPDKLGRSLWSSERFPVPSVIGENRQREGTQMICCTSK